MKSRLHVYYSGRVQGVGFRFTARRIASGLGMTGWIRNLDDGRVEVICEGSDGELKEFMRKIVEIFRDKIADSDAAWEIPRDEFSGFDIIA